jgi:hypothetical protein
VGGISKFLGTKRSNLHRAREWRQFVQILGVSPWAFFQRKKLLDGFEEETKSNLFVCGGLLKMGQSQ